MASAEDNSQRLDRIEEKIDKLSEAMIHLARAEEKLVAIERTSQNTLERLNRHSVKIDEMQRQIDNQERTVATVNKLFWIAITAAVAAIIANYLN